MTEPTPKPKSQPDLATSAGQLISTVATAAESAIVRAGTHLEGRLVRGLGALTTRLDAALRPTDAKRQDDGK